MWPLILSLVDLIPACQLICLKSSSARIPKIPLTSTMAAASPSSSNGVRMASKAALTRRWTEFIVVVQSPVDSTSADVAESLQLLDDVRVGLGALELRQLLLEDVHDELTVRGVPRDLGYLLDAIDQVRVELDLVAATEHVNSLSLSCRRASGHWRTGLPFIDSGFSIP